jgi:esterase/lipase superfamily enzyme
MKNKKSASLDALQNQQPSPVMPAKNYQNTAELQLALAPILKSAFTTKLDVSAKIEVFVVTNRQQKTPNFGCSNVDFSNELHQQTKYGSCIVLASGRRSVGEIIANENNVNTSLKTLQATSFDKQQFFTKLSATKATPLVYVHGFNTKYEEAVLRASQLAYDLKYQGPVLVFTWPAGSVGEGFDELMLKKTYQINKINAIGSINPFIEFLQEMQARNIKANFIVHSMGHQIVLTAMHQIGQQATQNTIQTPLLNQEEITQPITSASINSNAIMQELFLLAPDYEANLFQQNLAIIKKLANRITLYCSQNDKALVASKITNNNHRLGECIKINDPDLDIINVSHIDNNLTGLGHSYFKYKPVLTDIYLALLGFEVNNRLFINKASSLEPEKFTLRP